MKVILLTLVCILAPLTALAEDDWVYIVSSNKEDVYMKTASVKVNDDFYSSVNAWVKYEDTNNEGYDVSKLQYYCKSDSFKKLETHRYDKDGNIVRSDTISGNIQYAVPDTIGVDLTEAACISAALTKLMKFHYVDDGDITDKHYKEVIDKFGEYSMPAMLYYNEKTGNTN